MFTCVTFPVLTDKKISLTLIKMCQIILKPLLNLVPPHFMNLLYTVVVLIEHFLLQM